MGHGHSSRRNGNSRASTLRSWSDNCFQSLKLFGRSCPSCINLQRQLFEYAPMGAPLAAPQFKELGLSAFREPSTRYIIVVPPFDAPFFIGYTPAYVLKRPLLFFEVTFYVKIKTNLAAAQNTDLYFLF